MLEHLKINNDFVIKVKIFGCDLSPLDYETLKNIIFEVLESYFKSKVYYSVRELKLLLYERFYSLSSIDVLLSDDEINCWNNALLVLNFRNCKC